MKLASTIVFAALAAGAAKAAVAGEDSTHRWHGVGPDKTAQPKPPLR